MKHRSCMLHEKDLYVQQKTRPLLSNCTVKLTYLAAVAAMAMLVSAALHATDNDVSSANQLVRTVLENEMRAEDQDHSHWMYRLEKAQPTKRQIKEVVETEKEGLGRTANFSQRAPLECS